MSRVSRQFSLSAPDLTHAPATAVHPQHPAVLSKRSHLTIGDIEAKLKRAEKKKQEEKEAKEKRKGEIHVAELWKPFENTVPFFVAAKQE